jgi:LAO/AO transport system kinase
MPGAPRPADVAGAGVQGLAEAVRDGHRASIAQAITLVESRRPDHRRAARELLAQLAPLTGRAVRVGVSGVPGVGKSTFIDQLGTNLTSGGHRVAVLAVDPSSARSGGSILGDKTRMARLATDPQAFVRPSPSSGTLGGVARATRETILVMEAAGYDVVLVETVGVGQSEYVVAGMVDTFVLLGLARSGDQLQGMKRGILELADVIAVNKADEAHEVEARAAAQELISSLRLLGDPTEGWEVPVVTCSGLHDIGLDVVWDHVLGHRRWLADGGRLEAKRRRQLVEWSRAMVAQRLLARLDDPAVRATVAREEAAVLAGDITPEEAAEHILAVAEANRGSESR